MIRRAIVIWLALNVVLCQGCAIWMRGPNESVMINWSVPNAKAMLDAKPLPNPGNQTLSRGDDHILVVDAPGYKRKLVTIKSEVSLPWAIPECALAALLAVSIIALPLAIPLLVDGTSGACCDLNPTDVDVKLEQDEAPPPRPAAADWPAPTQPAPTIPAPKPGRVCRYCGGQRGDGPTCAQCGAR